MSGGDAMIITSLDRKLLREVSRLKGQILTIALVIAAGITSFIALRGAAVSLEWSRQAYYDRCRFAHVFAMVERAPESVGHEIERLPGVETVQTRISKEVTLPMEGMDRPAYARILSLPSTGQPATNALVLRSGRLPMRGHDDEAAVLEPFAKAHGIGPGGHVPAVINGKLRKLRVVGIVLSPEFVYAIRPGAFMDDPTRYAVLWMDRSSLAAAFQLDGAFNDVTLRLQPGASEGAVRDQVDRILKPFGSDGSVDRKHQSSNRILDQELDQLGSIAGMVPAVFLAVAAFLINMVLGRLIALQRTEIAALKAVGYTNREVGRHFLGLVTVVMIPGTALGVVGGWLLGRTVLGMYGGIFRFPDLELQMSAGLVATAILASSVSAVIGALVAVRAAVRLPPAEAMRPPAPSRYGRGLLDRLGVARLAGPSGMMILRELGRRPLRTLLSSLGMAGAIALVVLGHFGIDSLDRYLEDTLRREQRQDLSVAFVRPVSARAVSELAHMPGVVSAEGFRMVPVRARWEQRSRDLVLMGFDDDAALRRLIERKGGAVVRMPPDGVLASKALADVLGFRVGDRIELELRDGARRTVRPVVVGLVDESMGLQVYGRMEIVAALERDLGATSVVLVTVRPEQKSAVEARLRRSPIVIDVSDFREDMERLRAMNGAAMDVWTAISITLAALVIFGVVYNNARISLATRSRDLASLRVLGLTRGEISTILIGGLALEVLLAIPLGLLLGRAWSEFFMRTVDPEAFRWSVFVAPKTYLLAAAVAVVAAAASALWVRRSLDRLDLIGVLKTRE
jgi:putative ABC transport system permease protein